MTGHVRSEFLKGVAAAVLLASCAGASASPGPAAPRVAVRPGIDVLLTDSLDVVRGKRVGLVTNLSAVDARGTGDITRLLAADVKLVALFAPEHGLTVTAAPGERVSSTVDSATRIPIYSLYGRTVAPTPEMLAGLDLVLVDLPDVGARYFTYLATTIEVMKAAGARGIPVVVLDRPNPIGGVREGNILETAFASPVGALAMPMRHGLTAGEAARIARADLGIDVTLRVIPVDQWRRDQLFPATGLPFRNPSPNLQDVEALFLYPGTCLFEGTALSVGRGSDAPFKQIGAPWLDTAAVLARVRAARLPGVRFRGVMFTPHQAGDGKFNDTLVAGIRIDITDPARYRSVEAALQLLAIIQDVHPEHIRIGGSFDRLAGGPALRLAILRGDSPAAIMATWRTGLKGFEERVKPFLLYR